MFFLRASMACLILLVAFVDTAKSQSTLIPLTTRRGIVFDFTGNKLYISTSDGFVRTYNLAANSFGTAYNLGGSLNGIDIARDGSFLLVAQGPGAPQGSLQKINLQSGNISNIDFQLMNQENGVFDVAICSNGIALATSSIPDGGFQYEQVRQIDLTTNAVTIRSDAPGSDHFGKITPLTRIYRSANGGRCYFIEASSDGPIFTFDATTNTFGPAGETYGSIYAISAGAVNRDGTILGTVLNDYPQLGKTNTSLDTTSNFGFLHSFKQMNGGVAFDAVKDIFYTIGNGGTQIFAFDTNTLQELYRLNIGETITGNVTLFGTGTLVASQDGKYLALETPSGIRLFTLPTTVPAPTPSPTPTFSNPRDMVFDHAGKYLYITTAGGVIWRYDLLTNDREPRCDLGGPLNGVDIATDDSFLLVAFGSSGIREGVIEKVDLKTGAVSNFPYTRFYDESVAWDVAIASNGSAFITTDKVDNGNAPLRQFDLASGAVTYRFDSPTFVNQIQVRSWITRSADGTRLCFLESEGAFGSLFTYSAVSNTFGPSLNTNRYLDSSSIALNRDGSLVGVRLDYDDSASLDTAPALNSVHSFSGLDSGVAFDAIRNIFYGVNSSTDQIIGYDTNNFGQKLVLQTGEDVDLNSVPFGPGTLVASENGRYLALQTSTAVRVYAIPPNSGPALQVWNVGRLQNHNFIIQGFGAPNSSNTVKATNSLQSPFVSIGSVMADANGFIQFEDSNVGKDKAKFYLITSP